MDCCLKKVTMVETINEVTTLEQWTGQEQVKIMDTKKVKTNIVCILDVKDKQLSKPLKFVFVYLFLTQLPKSLLFLR